jgi:hypothetical protein
MIRPFDDHIGMMQSDFPNSVSLTMSDCAFAFPWQSATPGHLASPQALHCMKQVAPRVGRKLSLHDEGIPTERQTQTGYRHQSGTGPSLRTPIRQCKTYTHAQPHDSCIMRRFKFVTPRIDNSESETSEKLHA